MSVPTIRRSDLAAPGVLTEIGKGGEGTVFDIAGRPDVVYKEYLPRTGLVLNRAALERLIARTADFTDHERKRIASRAAWPTDLVVDGARVTGYVMPRIPDTYWRTHGASHDPRRVPCDLNYLTYRAQWQTSKDLVSDVPRLDIPDILRLLGDLAETMALLHRHGLVMGDVSGRNLLWTDRPALSVFVIDCDAFRPEGEEAVNPPKESPDWGDPTVKNGRTNRASDVYKLGLAAYRALGARASRFPPMSPEPIDGVPDPVIDLIWRSIASDGRPSAAEWATTTRQLLQFGNRPVVAVNAPRPSRPAAPPAVQPASADPAGASAPAQGNAGDAPAPSSAGDASAAPGPSGSGGRPVIPINSARP